MVFLRPSILRDSNASAIVTNEKYNLIRSRQIQSNANEMEDNPLILPEIKPNKPEEIEEDFSLEEGDDFF